MMPSRPSAALCTPPAYSRCSSSSGVSRSSPFRPMIAFIGVRISWLIDARNCDFAFDAPSARSRAAASSAAACSRSVTSREFTTKPRTLRSASWFVAVPSMKRYSPLRCRSRQCSSTVAPGCSDTRANVSITVRLSSGCSSSVSFVPDDLVRLVAEHPDRGRALVPGDGVLVEDGDQVGRVVHERAEPGRLALGGAPQQPPHRQREEHRRQAEQDLDLHEPRQRGLADLGDLARGVARHARQLGTDDAQLPQVGVEGRAGPTGGEQRRTAGEQLVDELAFVLELQPDRAVRRGGDGHELVEAALRAHDPAAVEERVGGGPQDLRARSRVGRDAVELQHHVLDVPLDEGPLARGDVDHQRRRALAIGGPGVVPDHPADEDDEGDDDHDRSAVTAERFPHRSHRAGLATSKSTCMPPR